MDFWLQLMRYLLHQKLHTRFQMEGVAKLMQNDFEIKYKKGGENNVAYALSIMLML